MAKSREGVERRSERRMITLAPALLIGAASAFIGFGEDTHGDAQGDPNGDPNGHAHRRGMMVDRLLRQVRALSTANAPWDAALVHHAGYWSHYDHRGERSSWPIPVRYAVDANVLADFARKADVLKSGPEVGDLFVLWSPARRRFNHTGIVLYVGQPGSFLNGQAFIECVVLSPNVHPDGTIGGPGTYRLTRRIAPDRGDWFIRWTELTPEWRNKESETAPQPQAPRPPAAHAPTPQPPALHDTNIAREAA